MPRPSCYHALCAHFVRARGDTALFAAQGLFNTALFIGLNVLFLAVFQWGIRGYVLSTTVANLVTTLVLIQKARLWRYVRLVPKSRLRRCWRSCSILLADGQRKTSFNVSVW